ncbi:hypothetical protein DMH04_13890 [Kibdelosporangium aridum]|uniref:Uncharacterized protein n=1 Tax=Kibdelosporangium aridum TaxID=2030 RepID=A0A428ZDY8_KIBAR|nr:hypothetical protein [Kibdelosporangium aridum]RSM86261.1 hypothetical protein DMH04_13890 [Kibdelosporangium aridum]
MPFTLRAAISVSILAATLMVAATLVGQFAGAAIRTAFWPVFWSSALVFFAVMADRQWGRVMLAVQAGLTVLLSPVLVFPASSELDTVARPDLAVGLAAACAAGQLIAVALAFLPPSTAYVRAAGELSPALRKCVLVVHVTSSVAWLGIITVQGSLGITAVTTEDLGVARAMFTAMLVIDGTFLGPAAFLAFFTGIVLAAGTRWGLLRRWWVATKFASMLVLMVLPIIAWQDIPVDGHALVEAGRPLVEVRVTLDVTPYLAMVSPALAVFAVVLSIVKPWGLTPLGRRESRHRTRR